MTIQQPAEYGHSQLPDGTWAWDETVPAGEWRRYDQQPQWQPQTPYYRPPAPPYLPAPAPGSYETRVVRMSIAENIAWTFAIMFTAGLAIPFYLIRRRNMWGRSVTTPYYR